MFSLCVLYSLKKSTNKVCSLKIAEFYFFKSNSFLCNISANIFVKLT